jgi:hypothetical protein
MFTFIIDGLSERMTFVSFSEICGIALVMRPPVVASHLAIYD